MTEVAQLADGNWTLRDLVVTNKLSAIANGLRMGNVLVLGSYLKDGILICPMKENLDPILAKVNTI